MPHRSHSFWLGLLGLFAVLALLLVGADVWLASRSGPRWKRRLVGAGLALMAFLGFLSWPERPGHDGTLGMPGPEAAAAGEASSPSGDAASPSPIDLLLLRPDMDADGEDDDEEGGEAPPRKASELETFPAWKKFAGAWKEAKAILDKKRALKKPFKMDDRKIIVERIAPAADHLDALVKDNALTEAEASVLEKEFNVLVSGLRCLPCVDEPRPTCYAPMPVSPPKRPVKPAIREPIWSAYKFLNERLPLIEKLASQDGVRPEVLEKVIGRMKDNLRPLFDEKGVASFPEEWHDKIEKLRTRVRELLDEIRRESGLDGEELPGAPSLQGNSAWIAVQEAWKEAREVVTKKRGLYPFDRAGKTRLLKALADAREELGALAGKGLINESGAELLRREFALLSGEVRQFRPKDMEPDPPSPVGQAGPPSLGQS